MSGACAINHAWKHAKSLGFYNLQVRCVTLALAHVTALSVEVHIRADAVTPLEPVEVGISVTSTIRTKEHVRADGLGIAKLANSLNSSRPR